MKMSSLPKDLVENVLSRVPVKFIRKVRLTCKKWNTLSKGNFFAKKHLGQDLLATGNKFMVVMMMDFGVYLMNINIQDNIVERQAKLIGLVDSYEVDVAKVIHCDGLLLCVTKDHTKLVVWNPYWGQTRWIVPSHNSQRLDFHVYAIGYDKSSYKILRFIDLDSPTPFVEVKIYDLNSDSWRILDVAPDGLICHLDRGVSLKGNTYWFARGKPLGFDNAFLLCFDFTSERFGPLLPLPFEWFPNNVVSLSSVREEQLAICFLRRDTLMLDIWITAKIEPNAVSWSNKMFLSLDMMPFIDDLGFRPGDGVDTCFFIDEEKEVAVVFGKDTMEEDRYLNPTRNVVYIIGVDGSFKKSYLGESPYKNCYPLGCSYAPSLVKLN